jgi:hypothetical protein
MLTPKKTKSMFEEQEFAKELQTITDDINRASPTEPPSDIQPDLPPDVPRVGALSAQAFNELAERVEAALKEMTSTQRNNIASQRIKCQTILNDLMQTFEQGFDQLERSAQEEQERLKHMGELLRQRVMERAQEMIRLSQQLAGFSGAVTDAHDKHLGDHDSDDSARR